MIMNTAVVSASWTTLILQKITLYSVKTNNKYLEVKTYFSSILSLIDKI
jgi:hypothetical protein